MLITTVIAVALGLTPIQGESPQIVNGDYSNHVGRFSQTVDRRGNTHIRGFSPTKRTDYDLTVHKNGYVEGSVGAREVTFHVRDAT